MTTFYAPEATRIASSNPIHVKLPEFSMRLSKDKIQDRDEEADGQREPIELRVPDSIESRWNIHIPMTITRYLASDGRKRVHSEKRLIRLSVESDFEKPFPQSHKIVLMDPVDDIFFHWTLHLTPFTFKSMASRMNWTYPQMAGNAFTETFRRFASLVRQCGNDVQRKQNTHHATIQISPDSSLATLIFHETVNQYRTVDILSMDFVESSWSDIKSDITKFTADVLREHEEIKMNLLQVLDTISIHQPTILMTCNELYQPIESFQPKSYLEARKRIDNPHLHSYEERMAKNKQFLAETEKIEMESNVVEIKTMRVPVLDKSDFHGKEVSYSKDLVFTFYLRKNETGQMSYRITITDPTDLFFHFTSVDIAPAVFNVMTDSLQMDLHPPMEKPVNKSSISRSTGTFAHKVEVSEDIERGRRWFHDVTGSRGVVGIISGDFMTGCTLYPERYKCMLNINRLTDDEIASQMIYPRPRQFNEFQKLKALEKEHHKQPALKAVLQFSETVMFHSHDLLKVEFRETPTGRLQEYIKTRFSETKFQIAESQKKLNALLRDSNAKNLGLFSLLDRPNRNSRAEHAFVPMVDEKHRFGFNEVLDEIGQKDSIVVEGEEKLAKEALFGPQVRIIPSKSVATMQIPVLDINPRKKKESRLYKPPTKIDPWFQKTSLDAPRPDGKNRVGGGRF